MLTDQILKGWLGKNGLMVSCVGIGFAEIVVCALSEGIGLPNVCILRRVASSVSDKGVTSLSGTALV